ncbi:hypothetical protein C0V70_01655 [Bacteriovorax stolpii]|uniref:Uncharacterized protein n=1 Tax=Bacteriovorax stolpii TaxID=960 RepID=A0A2K9NMT4_BACTC|nr:methyltransferase domain-containing protein [Bacteriovorax stolpii]AUN96829.1 hypothetical protein C0V70_01655 [Bacteriovorax stolpii]TDP53107.1 methyltransferase family protein [Bacteriovorax stolpii]
MSKIRSLYLEMLKNKYFNRFVFRIRFFYFVRFLKRIKVYDDQQNVIKNDYSLDMLKVGRTSDRPLKLIAPLAAIELVNKKGATLSIGSRYETEIFYLIGHGFAKDKIVGLDILSYSPYIDVGNMNNMQYSDSSFDNIIVGWVLPYSDDPKKAATEIIRVAKNGAYIAIGNSYYPKEKLIQIEKESGFIIGSLEKRLQSSQLILDLFEGHVEDVVFKCDPDRYNYGKDSSCLIIFKVKK